MRRLRSHLTYANVMVTLLAIGALTGGVAYAADTIGSSDVIDNSLQSVDLRNNNVRSADVQNAGPNGGGLTSADLAEGAVGPNQFQYGVLQLHHRTFQASTPTNTNSPKELLVSCPLAANGEEVTGGGYVIDNGGFDVPQVTVARSYAVNESTWLVRAVATSGTPTWKLTVVADCIN